MSEAITEGDYGLLDILLQQEEKQLDNGYLGRPISTVYKVTKVDEEELWVKEIGKDRIYQIPKRYFNKMALSQAITPHRVQFTEQTNNVQTLQEENRQLKLKMRFLENTEGVLIDQIEKLLKEKSQLQNIIKGLRKENISLNEKYLATIGERLFSKAKEKKMIFSTDVVNTILSYNKSVYENTVSVQFYTKNNVENTLDTFFEGEVERYVESKHIVANVEVTLDKRIHKSWRSFITSQFKNIWERKLEFVEGYHYFLDVQTPSSDPGLADDGILYSYFFQCDPRYDMADRFQDQMLDNIVCKAKQIVSEELVNHLALIFAPPETPLQHYVTRDDKGNKIFQNGSLCRYVNVGRSLLGDYKLLKIEKPPQDNSKQNDGKEIYNADWWNNLFLRSDDIEVKGILVNNKRLPLSKGLNPVTVFQ